MINGGAFGDDTSIQGLTHESLCVWDRRETQYLMCDLTRVDENSGEFLKKIQ